MRFVLRKEKSAGCELCMNLVPEEREHGWKEYLVKPVDLEWFD